MVFCVDSCHIIVENAENTGRAGRCSPALLLSRERRATTTVIGGQLPALRTLNMEQVAQGLLVQLRTV